MKAEALQRDVLKTLDAAERHTGNAEKSMQHVAYSLFVAAEAGYLSVEESRPITVGDLRLCWLASIGYTKDGLSNSGAVDNAKEKRNAVLAFFLGKSSKDDSESVKDKYKNRRSTLVMALDLAGALIHSHVSSRRVFDFEAAFDNGRFSVAKRLYTDVVKAPAVIDVTGPDAPIPMDRRSVYWLEHESAVKRDGGDEGSRRHRKASVEPFIKLWRNNAVPTKSNASESTASFIKAAKLLTKLDKKRWNTLSKDDQQSMRDCLSVLNRVVPNNVASRKNNKRKTA